MGAKEWTVVVVLGGILIWIVWDIYVVFFNKVKNDSISHLVRRSAWNVAAVSFAAGAVCGHWFGPGPGEFGFEPVDGMATIRILGWGAIASSAVQGISYLLWEKMLDAKLSRWMLMLYFLVGVAGGALFWPLGGV